MFSSGADQMQSGMKGGISSAGAIPLQPRGGPPACALFRELLPDGVSIAEKLEEGDPARLMAGERQLVEHVAPKRAREFSAGRVCARAALAEFGIVNVPVGALGDRRPQWPPGLTGSITHTDGFSAAAVGERLKFRAIGIDAERIGRISGDLLSHLLLPAELAWLESLPASEQPKVATLMFGAKEAFYKCQYEVTEQWLEFKDVALALAGGTLDRGSFAVRPVRHARLFERDGCAAVVHFAVAGELVLSAMVITAH